MERKGLIKIAQGTSKYGNISIYIREKIYAPYIFVFHPVTTEPLYDNIEFADDVIRILIEKGKLKKSGTYLLVGAAAGLQSTDCVVYENLARNGKDITREFSISHGAAEVSTPATDSKQNESAARPFDYRRLSGLTPKRRIEDFSVNHIRSSKKDEYKVDDGEGIYSVEVRHIEGNIYLGCDCLAYREHKYCDHTIAIAKLFIEPRLREYPEEHEFEVAVLRIAYGYRKIRVRAKSQFDAEQKALDAAGDYEFSEHDADYEIEAVIEVSSDTDR